MSFSFDRKGHNERMTPTGKGGVERQQKTGQERRQVDSVTSCMTSDRCIASPLREPPAKHSFGPGPIKHTPEV